MKFIILDFEALFVPTEGQVPVSEIACVVMEKGVVISTFHLVVQPCRKPCTPEEVKLSTTVFRSVTGLSFQTLSKYGIPQKEVISRFTSFITENPNIKWVARDPTLENRILKDWGFDKIQVEEILDYVQPQMRSVLYGKWTRPPHIREMAESFGCGYHSFFPCHCALTDVMEEYMWLVHFGI